MIARILIADREAPVVKALGKELENEGFTVQAVSTGRDTMESISEFKPDLIVLSDNLKDINRLDAIKLIKQETDALIVFTSKKSDGIDKAIALGVGADDYIVKPFDKKEVVARIKAHLRRQRRYFKKSFKVIENGPLRIIPDKRIASVDGKEIALTAVEFDILLLLAENAGRVLTKEAIKEVSAQNTKNPLRAYVYIYRLRKKLKYPELIETLKEIGYKMPRLTKAQNERRCTV